MATQRHTRMLDLFDLVEKDYKRRGLRSLDSVVHHRKKLDPYFGDRAANLVAEQVVNDYIDQRQLEGASNGTINRELAVLKRAYTLGFRSRLCNRRPYIEKLPEAEPREDFFEYDDFRKFEAALRAKGKRANYDGNEVADIVVFAYFSGWRLNEALQLNRDWIKTDLQIAVLPASKHKNKKPKIFPLEGEVLEIVERRLKTANPEGLLFHRGGRPIKSVRKICQSVCSEIKIGKKSFHALRRSLVTNLNRANVPIETGKRISGHRTDGVYKNYNQVTLDQLRQAVRDVNKSLGIERPGPLTLQNKNGLTSSAKHETNSIVNGRNNLTETEVSEPKPVKTFKSPELLEKDGGEGGIRTPETLLGSTRFRDNFPTLTPRSSSLFSSLKAKLTRFFSPKEEE